MPDVKPQAGDYARTIPIVSRLFLWSRTLSVVLTLISAGALALMLSGSVPQGRGEEGAWTVPLYSLLAVLIGLSLCLRWLGRRIAREVTYHGSLDALTGLPNRSIVDSWLARPDIAVMFIDLDRFKDINDNLGHAVGDDVLRVAAQRIRRVLRASDLVVRQGGDEFLAVVQDADAGTVARSAAGRVLSALRAPIRIDGRDVLVTGSIGVAVRCDQLQDPQEILRAGDLALYRAKRQGRDRFVVFNQAVAPDVLDQLDLETDLWQALERRELELHYQPEVSIETGKLTGFEALLRWRHPSFGLLRPGRFIGLAEENGAMGEIGKWVISEVCAHWRRWKEMFPGREPVTMSVNLSTRELEQEDLAQRVEQALEAAAMEPSFLKFDVNESALSGDNLAAVKLGRLRRTGVRLSLDDFGAGFASLDRMRQLPVTGVKIDQSFTRNLDEDDSNLMTVQAIVTMAHDLGLDVTAEGIETRRQLERLSSVGCDQGQGYYLSKPVPPEEVEALLRSYYARSGLEEQAAAS